MKVQRLITLSLVAVLAVALAGCGGKTGETSDSDVSGSIRIEGSDTMVNLANGWREAFEEVNPDVMISIKGGGTGTGVAAIINGTVDFANASREVKDEERVEAEGRGTNFVETEVAKDGIAVVIHPSNAVKGLTLEQLGQIYRGEIVNWKNVGGADARIVLLSRDSASGTYEFFKEAVVGKEKEYSRATKLLASTQGIVDETKANPNAIGYVGLGFITPDLKVVEIDGVAASIDTALDGSYPLSRGLYMYSNGEPTGVMRTYLDWILGPDGQAIATELGFVPVAK